MPPKNKAKVTLYVGMDVAEFIRNCGGYRSTDLSQGKVNVSAEVDNFLHELMAGIAPETLGLQLVHRKEELQMQMEDVDRQAHEIFGMSTIEEWHARYLEARRKKAQVNAEQMQIREDIHQKIWGRLSQEFSSAMKAQASLARKHRKPQLTTRTRVRWIERSFKKELRTLGISAPEALVRLEREQQRGPEVA